MYYAGTFANLLPFKSKKAAMSYAKKLSKETSKEVRVITPSGDNIIF
jgi:hypothetical protein